MKILDKYILKFSYLGYSNRYKRIETFNESLQLGKILLKESAKNLTEVEVKTTQTRGEQKGDTTSFNSETFKTNPDATRYHQLTFDEAIIKNLKVMDATALALCRDQKLPINVFSIFRPGALKRVVLGEDEGTLVHA